MSEPRVIQADYASWRPVSGRKVLQLVFEVPIEQTERVMLMLGVPMPGESKWCAIALLDKGTAAAPVEMVELDTPTETPEAAIERRTGNDALAQRLQHSKDRKPFASLPLVQQAAMRTEDKDFQLFLEQRGPIHDQESYADVVRAICGVESRANIKLGTQAGVAWMELEGKYQDYLTDRKYAEVRK